MNIRLISSKYVYERIFFTEQEEVEGRLPNIAEAKISPRQLKQDWGKIKIDTVPQQFHAHLIAACDWLGILQ